MGGIKTLLGFAFALLPFSVSPAAAQGPIFLDQGPNWTAATRADFYTRDQGSRMIPLAWLQALKQPNGQPFLGDSLARYGYLPNPANTNGLPVGFNASGPMGVQVVGMVCSACHTREISVEGRTYRADGGPALADFQGLLTELDTAVGQILASDAAFKPFAISVLQSGTPDPADVAALRGDVDAWYLRYHTLMTRALPSPAWGLGRLDAVGMIFNRLSGLDLGPPPSLLIPDNIKKADAPVRYPFLWNAAIQDKTQWPGFADNGSDILGLARNLGEVIGVFGRYEPKRDGLLIDFLNNHSFNFDGLGRLEDLIKLIAPPKWPWSVDVGLAAQGKEIFARPTASGGCQQCHGITPGTTRFPFNSTWATPIQNVGTDTREYDVLAWTAKTGVLQGAFIPFATDPLKETDLVFNILATSVIGSIAEHVLQGGGLASNARVAAAPSPSAASATASASSLGLRPLPPSLKDLTGAFNAPAAIQGVPSSQLQGRAAVTAAAAPAPKGSYESRVLQGIWATAPYLHNGSVATLADLLKPAAQRAKQFKMGSAYDTVNLGIAVDQPQSNYVMVTTDCSDLNSGNSRCGHEFGTQLTDPEKKALLEYLKTL
jgi:mono/diheme cytochrome c family protein